MKRRRVVSAAPPVLVALALTLAACSGDDDGDAPSGGTTPPSPGALPPQLLDCFADEGYDIESPNEIHTAPQDVVEECFNALHQGGA